MQLYTTIQMTPPVQFQRNWVPSITIANSIPHRTASWSLVICTCTCKSEIGNHLSRLPKHKQAKIAIAFLRSGSRQFARENWDRKPSQQALKEMKIEGNYCTFLRFGSQVICTSKVRCSTISACTYTLTGQRVVTSLR